MKDSSASSPGPMSTLFPSRLSRTILHLLSFIPVSFFTFACRSLPSYSKYPLIPLPRSARKSTHTARVLHIFTARSVTLVWAP